MLSIHIDTQNILLWYPKIIKIFFFLVYIKMDPENIRLSKYKTRTYIISDQYLDNKRLMGIKMLTIIMRLMLIQ